ncbi:MAG: hypothetical protein KIT77_22450 [Caldilinea sp.]|nr:hypothetical protein [Caldilineaceae bacterium]MCB9120151.1 hypothetical protein [Caldilineaceae bacterium]MCW5844028.1 hypothetical protein [Caldilinea sp.]
MGWLSQRMRHTVAVVLALAMVLSATPAYAAPAAQTPGGDYTVGDCSQIDRTQLRNEIEAHVLAVLQNEAAPFDVDAIVDRAWSDLQMDAVVDTEVTRAVNDVLNNEDYLNRLLSGWWGEKAQEYAERVANDAFGSPAFRARLDELSAAIGAEVARQVEAQFAQAASVALLCLQAYVGEQYSTSFFSLFAERVQAETHTLDLDPLDTPQVGALTNHQLALAGVGTILATQLVYRLSQKLGQKIAQRVAGKVVGRVLGKAGSSFIPIAGWIIGIGMIVYDLWEGGQGALPQIQEGLQSPEVKQKIREEIADAVKDDLPEQASLIALETAVSLTEQWQGFCGAYEYVCLVAEQNDGFRRMLQEVTLDELADVAALVNFYMRELGRAELDTALADGSLARLLPMPDAALTVLRETHSTATTLAWSDLAAGRLDVIAEWGVHRRAVPADFTPATFDALLALGDAEPAQKLLALPADERTALLELPGEVLAKLAAVEPVADLDWLAGYLLLPGQQPQTIAEEVVEGKVTVAELRGPAPRVEPTATLLPVEAALTPVTMATLSETNPGEQSSALPSLLLVLLLLVGAAGAGATVWWRRRE